MKKFKQYLNDAGIVFESGFYGGGGLYVNVPRCEYVKIYFLRTGTAPDETYNPESAKMAVYEYLHKHKRIEKIRGLFDYCHYFTADYIEVANVKAWRAYDSAAKADFDNAKRYCQILHDSGRAAADAFYNANALPELVTAGGRYRPLR